MGGRTCGCWEYIKVVVGGVAGEGKLERGYSLAGMEEGIVR